MSGGFRIGRKFAQHSYPSPPRGGSGVAGGGSNYASGPETDVGLDGPTDIEWSDIASGDPASTEVPVTLSTTGYLLIEGVICIKNTTGDTPTSVSIDVLVDSVLMTVPANERVTILENGFVAIPFLVETEQISLGSHTVTIVVNPANADVLALSGASSTIKIQEVSVPTG